GVGSTTPARGRLARRANQLIRRGTRVQTIFCITLRFSLRSTHPVSLRTTSPQHEASSHPAHLNKTAPALDGAGAALKNGAVWVTAPTDNQHLPSKVPSPRQIVA